MGTITKALNLLNYFSESKSEIGLLEFKKLSSQDKATIHRHLTELEKNGFLEQDQKTRKYRLGGALLRLSFIREKTFPTTKVVSHWVDALSEELGELVHASMMQGERLSPIYYRDAGSGGTRVYFDQADMLPLHATASGLVMLSFGEPGILARAVQEPLIRYTDYTVTDPDTLNARVNKARRVGFSYSDQAIEVEVCSVAVPFFDGGNYAAGSIATAVPATRMSKSSKAQFVEALWRTSEKISSELGGSIPDKLRSVWQK